MAQRTKKPRAERRNDRRGERVSMSPSEKVMQEARDRLKRGEDWESSFWQLYVQDIKFRFGDSDNGWQWPDDLRKDREINKRPTLTINKVGPLCQLITNNQRQNKAAVKVRPANDRASYDAAQIFEGLVRQIEYASNAQAIYDDAGDSQVEGGIGYWKINTRYVDAEPGPDADAGAFDQECVIEPVPAHRNVVLDCDIQQKDGSDAEWGLIYDDVPDDEFEAEYGTEGDEGVGAADALTENDSWTRDGYTRIVEYYRIVKTPDELIWTQDGNETATVRKSEMPDAMAPLIARLEKEDPDKVKRRPVEKRQLEWYKIAGNRILDQRKLKGKYIPIIRCVGLERVIDGKLERKGHVRTLKDAQRMYNYNSSGQVEFGALQTKTPWVVAAASIQGQETAWNNANRSNAAYLTYRHADRDGNSIPPPQRTAAPGDSPAFMSGMEIADKEMMMASGQFHDNQGKQSNAISGRAIGMRQQQGDTATYHFVDGMGNALRYTGVVLLDLIPLVYNTERVQQILGLDGKQTQVKIDPNAKEAYKKIEENKDDVTIIFNPAVGRYAVVSDPGPSYATRRQEAWAAFVQIVTSSPELIDVIGDYMFEQADFPLAGKIAERIRNKIRATAPWLLDDEAPGPLVQKLQTDLNQATQQVAELLEKLADNKRALKSRDQKRDIEAFRAETTRIKDFGNTVKDLVGDPKSQRMLMDALQNLLQDMYGDDIVSEINQQQDGSVGHPVDKGAEAADAPSADEQPPMLGARKAKDGQWYVKNPNGQGFARVMTEAANAA